MKKISFLAIFIVLSMNIYSKEFNLRCPIDEVLTFEIYVMLLVVATKTTAIEDIPVLTLKS